LRGLIETNTSIVQYIFSSTLYHSPDEKDPRYILPYVDPVTGVRVKDGYWIRKARNADVIVLNRGPVPAPASTYTSGNWSFVDKFSAVHAQPGPNLSHQIINAALHVTLETFLPDVIQVLRMIRMDKLIQDRGKLVLWHGSILDISPRGARDPWALYHNTQGVFCSLFFSQLLIFSILVLLHNAIMPYLLPHYGVIFLPISFATLPKKGHVKAKIARQSPRPAPEEAKLFLRGLERALEAVAKLT
jgi:hypothetical protein